ncbi:GDYXXLXY domain-containing protein [Shewanella sp. NIFS-20-20]|uniref:GDYXXLXY domain-containing protein n=1 Tax=Shewanella sp. NIFS-20-20 TaxID=2853806 RepID=UPI001C45E097|nr:GDYXXLXY domain-containing protein [Shewanella sp. NIFS-20-20]MBV7315993.1 GDYXXLXY domain-containing protein [Shewanella sp. NIFS-20-20]
MNKGVVIFTLVALLIAVNWSIYQKEQHLAHGHGVYLPLAPIDPRSIMQGDYMALRFALSQEIKAALISQVTEEEEEREPAIHDGLAVIALDDNHQGHLVGVYAGEGVEPGQLLMKYRWRNGQVMLATNAFFFEEGQGSTFATARYGYFKVDDDGELLLVSLHDQAYTNLALSTEATPSH